MSNALLLRAADFAARAHATQKRKNASHLPFVTHPLRVAKFLAVDGGIDDTATLVAALLHGNS